MDDAWFEGSLEYWKKQDASVNGMLGGLGVLHNADVHDSKTFIERWYCRDHISNQIALDVGAGIGRVSENSLLPFFRKVSIIESDVRFIESAKIRLGLRLHMAHHMRLQSYKNCDDDTTYNLIWIQWVLMYASDDELVDFLTRCIKQLSPGGLIGVKENTIREDEPIESFDVDSDDRSIVRSPEHFRKLFASCMVTCKGYNSARLNIFKTTFSKKYMHIERKTLHKPVLLKELVSFAEKNECQYIVDATFGGGGYSESFLRMTHGPKVHALDIDNSVMQNVNIVHENFGSKFSFSHISFSMMNTIFDRHSQKPDCIVFDLGISTDQIKSPDRGFSFQIDGPLDMRISKSFNMVTLNDLINWGSQKLIESVLIEFGEEIHAPKISEAIVKYRQNYGSIKSTKILSKIIEDVVPIKFIGKKTFYSNPCTRSFQAFRIKINDELKVLKEGLDSAVASLSENGHIAVVTFHALEDRIVKVFMKNHVNNGNFQRHSAIYPTKEEINENRSSRSAKLRIMSRVN